MNFDELAGASLLQATQDLLPELGRAPVCRVDEPHRIAAMIGFAGDELRGTFGIAANDVGLQAVRRHMGASDRAGASEDAIGELANLLIGQLKRTWSKHGALITISTPMVVRGLAIEVCGVGEGHWTSLCLSDARHQVSLWIDAHPSEQLTLSEGEAEVGALEQGEAMLF